MYSYTLQQVYLIIQNYLLSLNEILTPVGCLSLIGFLLFILVTLKLREPKTKPPSVGTKKPPQRVVHQHIDAIAGEDVMTTQLDLARAYIEMGEINLAKQILTHVSEEGNPAQQRQAQQLIMDL